MRGELAEAWDGGLVRIMVKWIDLPPVWLLGFLGLAWVQARSLPLGAFGGWGALLGAVLILVGIALAVAAVAAFRRHRTTVIPHMTPTSIVTTGIYSLSRNPIYLGDALILLGFVLRWDAVPSLILVPLFMVLIQRRFIRAEEARLAQEFPNAFAAYRAATRRWL